MLANLITLENLQKTHGHPSPQSSMSIFNAVTLLDFENSPDAFDFVAAMEVVVQFSKALGAKNEKEIAFWGPQYDKLKAALSNTSAENRPVCEKWKQILSQATKDIPTFREITDGTGEVVDSKPDTETPEQEQHQWSTNSYTKEMTGKISGSPEEIDQFVALLCGRLGINRP